LNNDRLCFSWSTKHSFIANRRDAALSLNIKPDNRQAYFVLVDDDKLSFRCRLVVPGKVAS
jgi:hypothetical protein